MKTLVLLAITFMTLTTSCMKDDDGPQPASSGPAINPPDDQQAQDNNMGTKRPVKPTPLQKQP
jgi:hypothetical protein